MKTPTASQTVGPFFSIGLGYRNKAVTDLSHPPGKGNIRITGTVLDAEGVPVPDAQLEIWQADPSGHYNDIASAEQESGFDGFTRIATDDRGVFTLQTTMPGDVQESSGETQAPHLAVTLFMRGLLRHLQTRIYFADHPLNAKDKVLAAIPAERQYTLMAVPEKDLSGCYRWDVHLQGSKETAFFAY